MFFMAFKVPKVIKVSKVIKVLKVINVLRGLIFVKSPYGLKVLMA